MSWLVWTTMSPDITLELVEEIPTDSRVCHYDELTEDAKEEFPVLTEAVDVSVDCSIVAGLRECDLVKYTDYYEITIS